jgi:hypothetical protein
MQIFGEIDDRLRFQEEMAGVKGAGEAIATVRLEIAARVSELQKLGVNISAARKDAPSVLSGSKTFLG